METTQNEKIGSSEKIQNKFLNALRTTRQPVTLFLMNGFQLKGTIVGFDEFCIAIYSSGRDQVVYKHAISTVSPDSTFKWNKET